MKLTPTQRKFLLEAESGEIVRSLPLRSAPYWHVGSTTLRDDLGCELRNRGLIATTKSGPSWASIYRITDAGRAALAETDR